MTDYDGAPVHGYVSDPAATSGPPSFPRLTEERIATCPDCFGDLIDEGTGFWCGACRQPYTFAQVAYFEDGDLPDA